MKCPNCQSSVHRLEKRTPDARVTCGRREASPKGRGDRVACDDRLPRSNKIRKNGHRRGKQNYHCKECTKALKDSLRIALKDAAIASQSPIYQRLYSAWIFKRS